MPRRSLRPHAAAALATVLAGPALADTLTFTLVNETGRPILELYASPPSQRAWGVDRLGRDVLSPGASRAVRVVGDGSCRLDIQVVIQGGPTEERRGWDACATPRVVWGAAATPPATVPPMAAPLPPAVTPPATVPPAVTAPRPPMPGPQVAASPPPPPVGGAGKTIPGAGPARREGNPSFNLVNRDGRTIVQFYASPSSQSDWGPDRLGAGTVPGGRRQAIRLPLGECVYDLRAVYAGGGSEERRNLDLCDVADVAIP